MRTNIFSVATKCALPILALLTVIATSCMAADDFLPALVGATATQIAFSYPVPSGGGYCTIQASTSSTLSPPAIDVNGQIFANAEVDIATARPSTTTSAGMRTVVIGQRTSQLATAGTAGSYPYPGVRHYSRALRANTTYYFFVNCPGAGTSSSPFSARTTNIPLGQTYGDPWLSDPAHPGDQPWPESIGGLTPEDFIDPLAGTVQVRIGLRGNNPQIWNLTFGSAFNQGQTTPCDSAGPWTDPCALATGGSGSATVANSAAPLVLRPPMSTHSPWDTSYGSVWSLDQVGLSLTGSVSSGGSGVLDVCLSLNGGISCASPVQQMTMSGSSGVVTLGDAPVNIWVPTQFGVDEWVLDTNPRLNAQESSAHSGTATVTNHSGTYEVTNNNTGDAFSLYWITGGNGTIRLSSNNDACITPPASTTSTEYRIASFTDLSGGGLNGSNIVLASGSTPPTGTNIYWCENNFTVMVWRDRPDSSTVTLTAAVLNVLGSAGTEYPDNGAGTDCFNTLVHGGYFCLYGNLYWINPAGPVVAYYGQPQGAGVNGSGTLITNSWTRAVAPTPESASIDQTQTNLTFNMIGYDPAGGGPLVIQGVFDPTAAPVQPTTPISGLGITQIGNAPVTGTTASSVTWGFTPSECATTPSECWTMTWTNLTPQSSVSESIVDQMAAFDPTFNPAYFGAGPSGWNCGLSGAASKGIFFFPCASIGGDSPSWIFAFSPGVGSGYGNTACAGPSACGAWPANGSGPQIIGAINTFNTPNGPVAPGQGALTGRSLHAIAGTGESGWIAIGGNPYVPINTSATSIPSSSSACSTFSGLGSLSGQCIQIDINNFTQHGLISVTSVSGSAPSGSVGQTCLLSSFNNGLINGAAIVTLGTHNSWTGATILITNPGYDASAAPTSAADNVGTAASCPSPVTISTTVTSVSGYEPYFATPNYFPFLGNPGELRTTQIGDTACVTTTGAGSCNWPPYVGDELMTLVQKNPGGQWVFQRATHVTERQVTPPIALWWESYQSLIPPGATNQSQAVQVFWNPIAGCGGSPDPHGNCLIMDQNETNAHAEWQDGGYVASTNVAQWGQTIYGWPTSYQTIVGSLTTPCLYSTEMCILAYPFADFLPYPDTYTNMNPPGQTFTWQQGVDYTNANPGFACYGSGGFNCTYGTPWGFDAGTHPNPAGANDPNNSKYAFDNIPVDGGQNKPAFSPVSGQAQLYSATPTSCSGTSCSSDPDDPFGYTVIGSDCSGGCAAINRKVVATAASCGSHPLIDLSGSSSTIAGDTTGSYTYCIARTAGECWSTSAAGEVFVNCPGVVYTSCTGSAIHGGTPLGVGNDICVGNIGVSANAIRQFALSPAGGSDAPGAYTRNVASATSRLRMVTGFENNRVLPDNSGSWILYRSEFLNYQRQDMWMSSLPGYPNTDGYNRGQFIPESVTVPAYAGTNNAVVEFGYQEYGLPTGYSKPAFMNCTTRNDPCWANAAAVASPPYSSSSPPFYLKSEYFKSGGPSLMSCSTGCTIDIPAISQRTLFYRVLYFSGNTHIATSAINVVEVP